MVQVIFGLGMILLVMEMAFRIIDRPTIALVANLASRPFATIVRLQN